jgi:hypothetical protein
MNASFAALPNMTFSPSGIAVAALLRLDWIVLPANGSAPVTAFSLLAQTDFSGAIVARAANGTQPAALLASIAYINSTLATRNSTVGPVNTPLLQALVDDVFAGIIVPIVNALFATGFPLPQVDGVTLVNPAVIYNDGFVTVASNFTFAPPSGSRPAAAAVPAESWHTASGDRDEVAPTPTPPDRHIFLSGSDDDDNRGLRNAGEDGAPAPPRDEVVPLPFPQPDRHTFLSGNDDAAADDDAGSGGASIGAPPLKSGRPDDDDPVLRPVRDVLDQLRGAARRRGTLAR